MHRRALVLIAAALALAPGAASRAAGDGDGGGVVWVDEPRRALESALAEQKPVLMDIWAVWCAPCKLMDRTTYKDPAVVEAARRFTTLKVDADVHKTIINRYAIDAFPTVLFLDGKGREITRLLGFVEKPRLLATMNAVAEGYAGYLKNRDAESDPRAWAAVGRYFVAAGAFEPAISYLQKALKALPESDAGVRAAVELDLAEAQLGSGRAKQAAARFASLADNGGAPDVQARALWGLHRAEKQRGRDEEATEALERLRHEHPDLARTLESS